jgi:hypothetical protein
MVSRAALAVLLAPGLAGCTLIADSFLTNEFSGDPFPTTVDTSSGALLVGVQPADEMAPRPAVLDVLSPFTLVDPARVVDPSLRQIDVALLGRDPVAGTLTLPRARFPDVQLITLRPCGSGTPDADGRLPDCTVGTQADPRPIQAVLGADALAGDAVRLRLGDNQIFVLADVGGDDAGRSLSCDAVFDAPYRGGGTLVIAGSELSFINRRITLAACLGPDPDPGPKAAMPTQRGADALFVVSTGIGISILGETAYERYRLAVPEAAAPPVTALPTGSVYMPSGLVSGHLGAINRLSLVGAAISNGLSPCRQIYAHHQLADGPVAQAPSNMTCNQVTSNDCPCKDGSSSCTVPAIFELTPPAPGVAVLVVSDADPTLQALRTELRPDQAEVDGVLGTDVFRSAEVDVDYPHDRLLARCAGPGCLARPQMTNVGRDRCAVNRCIYGDADDIGCR